MLELLAPAGSSEGVVAAVHSGADAVYMSFGELDVPRSSKRVTDDEFAAAAEYCRVRGVKLYVALEALTSDDELPRAVDAAKRAQRLGADALILRDLGLMRTLSQALPEMRLHAGSRMGIHDIEGVRAAAALGAARVSVAVELPGAELAAICAEAPVEIETLAHGPLCMCYAGQCYMSALHSGKSGNRGKCTHPCRLPCGAVIKSAEYQLSLKDYCLVRRLGELSAMGVKCIRIRGRSRPPEYAAVVTSVFSRVLREGTPPTADEVRALEAAYSHQGFTDGYFDGKKGPQMLGVREETESRDARALFASAKKFYLNNEFQRVPVRFAVSVRSGEAVRLAARDDLGNTAVREGAKPEPAFHRELTSTSLQTQLFKTGGTPFFCAGVKSSVDPGLTLSTGEIGELRSSALTELMEKRRVLTVRREAPVANIEALPNREEPPCLTVSVMRAAQLSPALAAVSPRVLYVPLTELAAAEKALRPFLENPDTTVCAVLPRVLFGGEKKDAVKLLEQARRLGIKEALAGSIGHIVFAVNEGFEVRGDFGLNIFNSRSLDVCRSLRLKSAVLSFEARFEQLRAISKCIDTELVVYGRLPLMLTESCLVKNTTGVCSCGGFSGLSDKRGLTFPVMKEYGCRNVVFSSKKLYLADRSKHWTTLGLWGARLMFTTENSLECAAVAESYSGRGGYAPNGYTRGLYRQGVE